MITTTKKTRVYDNLMSGVINGWERTRDKTTYSSNGYGNHSKCEYPYLNPANDGVELYKEMSRNTLSFITMNESIKTSVTKNQKMFSSTKATQHEKSNLTLYRKLSYQ